jgi:stage III sporulation protein SpoIIIAA
VPWCTTGSELENLIKNPTLSGLLGGIESVTLGDEEARRRGVQKSILERAGPPTFDVAVSLLAVSTGANHEEALLV